MENQNTDKQASQIRRNPTRFNTNVNQGKANEKTFDAETDQNREFEGNPKTLDNDETNFDRSGDDSSTGNEDASFSRGEETKQADGQIEGSIISRETESETSHKGQAGGQHASSLGVFKYK